MGAWKKTLVSKGPIFHFHDYGRKGNFSHLCVTPTVRWRRDGESPFTGCHMDWPGTRSWFLQGQGAGGCFCQEVDSPKKLHVFFSTWICFNSCFFCLAYWLTPPKKLTWQWKNNHLKMYLLSKNVILYCHVSFRCGIEFRHFNFICQVLPVVLLVKWC